MSKLLEIVRIGGDAIREGRLEDAYTILGPGGEGAVDFGSRRSFGRSQGGVRAHWQEIYDQEELDAFLDERPVDYDSAVTSNKEYIRDVIERTARAEWKDQARVSSFDAVLKQYYTEDKVREFAQVPNPFLNLIRKAT